MSEESQWILVSSPGIINKGSLTITRPQSQNQVESEEFYWWRFLFPAKGDIQDLVFGNLSKVIQS